MKTVIYISLFLCILIFSCKREDEIKPPTYNINHYYIMGTIYDSITGNIVQGQKIYSGYQGWVYPLSNRINCSFPVMTDQNGVFCGYYAWSLEHNDYSGPPGDNLKASLLAKNDTQVGYYQFKFGDLKMNDTILADLYLKPAGYLALTFIDTTSSDFMGWFGTNYSFEYPINCYHDTTQIFQVIGNSIVYLHYYPGYPFEEIYDTIYVPRRDTTAFTIYF